MYTIVTPHKNMTTAYGAEFTPVMTLKDGDTLCHIVRDDGCYVAFLYIEESGFIPVTYIFPELHMALCSLPNPEIDPKEETL